MTNVAKLGVLLSLLPLVAGCADEGTPTAVLDPFAGECDFPSVTEMGSNAALVGGVMDMQKTRLEGVVARVVPREAGASFTDTSNQGGCYYLSVEAGKAFDVSWSKPGYVTVSQSNVLVPSGEKRIHHVTLTAD